MSPPYLRRAQLPIAFLLPATLLAGGLLFAIGCGKKGPPLPPLKRGPDRVTAVTVRQMGKQVMLTGILPDRSQDGSPVAPVVEVRIFRLDRGGLGMGGAPSSKSAQRAALRQFSKEAKRVAVLSGETLGKALSGRRVTYADPEAVPGSITAAGKEFVYGLTVVDAQRRSSPLSALAAIHLIPPPLPPSELHSEVSEKKIRLSWQPPASQGGEEALRYNVYRYEEGGAVPERPRNEKPLPQLFFEEEDFAFGHVYYYVVRSTVGEKPPLQESEDSAPLPVTPVDVYPPAAPTGLAVSAENGVVKLYWFPNGEPDVGGYRVYRSEREDEGFQLIGSVGAGESTYVDADVEPGVKYYYAITALDQSTPPNESSRSEVHGDRLPPAAAPSGAKPPKKN